jgi:sec-independent protein translocase protein TatC
MAKSQGETMSFLQHLEILRWHLIRASAAILVMATVCFFGKHILFDVIIFGPKDPNFITYQLFCQFTQLFSEEGVFCLTEMPFSIINNKMAGQFSTHIWVSLIGGFILAFPYVLFEVWRFIKPGLHPKERKHSRGVIFFASILFLLGVLFGYYLIAPLSVQFLGGYNISDEISNLIDLLSYISTVTTVTLSAGLIFELPIIVYFLARVGILTPEWMRKYRKHALVLILILSAIITPPDISSQVLVTLPVLLLYELSIKICARVVKNQEKKMSKELRKS